MTTTCCRAFYVGFCKKFRHDSINSSFWIANPTDNQHLNWIPSSIQTSQTRQNRCSYFRPWEAHIDFFWIHNATKEIFIITKNIGLPLPNRFITHIWISLLYVEYKHRSSSIGNQRYVEQHKKPILQVFHNFGKLRISHDLVVGASWGVSRFLSLFKSTLIEFWTYIKGFCNIPSFLSSPMLQSTPLPHLRDVKACALRDVGNEN